VSVCPSWTPANSCISTSDSHIYFCDQLGRIYIAPSPQGPSLHRICPTHALRIILGPLPLATSIGYACCHSGSGDADTKSQGGGDTRTVARCAMRRATILWNLHSYHFLNDAHPLRSQDALRVQAPMALCDRYLRDVRYWHIRRNIHHLDQFSGGTHALR
jgi:hypothetical protein